MTTILYYIILYNIVSYTTLYQIRHNIKILTRLILSSFILLGLILSDLILLYVPNVLLGSQVK